MADANPPAVRPTQKNRTNVPKGWSIRRLKTKQSFPLKRVKTRIGTSDECEVKMRGTVIDKRQCYLEYDGSSWKLHQESHSQPTFVNGKPAAHIEVRHGSKISFSDGSGFEMISVSDMEKSQSFRRNALLLLALGALAGAAVAAFQLLN